MPPSREDFQDVLNRLIGEAGRAPGAFVDLKAREVHRIVGSYPDPESQRMPICRGVMRAAMRAGDAVLYAPTKGNGASLTIRYQFPR